MGAFSFVRLSLLGLVWALSIAILGISANELALSVGTVWSFPSVALAASITTHAVATPMIVISLARKDAATSRVIIEIAWVGVLWVVWLLVGVVTTSTPIFHMSCREYGQFFNNEAESECIQFTLLQVFAWLNAGILFFYALLIFSLALIQNVRTKPTDKKTNAFYIDASRLSFRLEGTQTTPQRSNYDAEKPKLALPVPVALSTSRSTKGEKEMLPSNPHAFWAERASRTSSLSSDGSSLRNGLAGSISPLLLPSQQLQLLQMSESPSRRSSHHGQQPLDPSRGSQSLHPIPQEHRAHRKNGPNSRRGPSRSTSRASMTSIKTTTSAGSGHRPAHVPSPLRKPVPISTYSQPSGLSRDSTILTSEERKYSRPPFEQQRY